MSPEKGIVCSACSTAAFAVFRVRDSVVSLFAAGNEPEDLCNVCTIYVFVYRDKPLDSCKGSTTYWFKIRFEVVFQLSFLAEDTSMMTSCFEEKKKQNFNSIPHDQNTVEKSSATDFSCPRVSA